MLDDVRITLGNNKDLIANFDTLKQVLSTESRLQDHFVEEGQLWMLGNGLYFEKGEVFSGDALLPSLLSTDSIPAVVSMGLKKIENKTAHIFYLQTFEQDDVQDFVADEIAFFAGMDLEWLMSLGSFDFFMQHETDLRVNTETHLCEKFIHRIVFKLDDYKVITRVIAELKEIK